MRIGDLGYGKMDLANWDTAKWDSAIWDVTILYFFSWFLQNILLSKCGLKYKRLTPRLFYFKQY